MRSMASIIPFSPAPVIPRGIYFIRNSGGRRCLQLNNDDSVTAAATDKTSFTQRWRAEYRVVDNTYTLQNVDDPEQYMGIEEAVLTDAGLRPCGTSTPTGWVIICLQDVFLICEPNATQVLDMHRNKTDVFLQGRDEDRDSKQLWALDLVDGSLPTPLIPGTLYSIINLETNDKLLPSANAGLTEAHDTTIKVYNLWQVSFDLLGNVYIHTHHLMNGTHYHTFTASSATHYLFDNVVTLSKTAVPCSLVNVHDPDDTYLIILNLRGNKHALSDIKVDNSYQLTLKDVDIDDTSQKWKITVVA